MQWPMCPPPAGLLHVTCQFWDPATGQWINPVDRMIDQDVCEERQRRIDVAAWENEGGAR